MNFTNGNLKSIGLMAKILRGAVRTNASSPPSLPHIDRVMGEGDKMLPRGSLTPASRILGSMVNPHILSDSAGTGSVSTSEELHTSSTPAPAEKPDKTGGNAFFQSLVESIFLIGPNSETIRDCIDEKSSSAMSAGDDVSVNSGNISGASGGIRVPDFNTFVPPSIIYHTECDNPREMFSLLPSYCYPR
jgi:hypothetical protein